MEVAQGKDTGICVFPERRMMIFSSACRRYKCNPAMANLSCKKMLKNSEYEQGDKRRDKETGKNKQFYGSYFHVFLLFAENIFAVVGIYI